MNRLAPPILTLALLVGVIAVGGWWLADHPDVWQPDDYVEYWAAGRLVLAGGDPYSAEQLLPLQRAAGRNTDEAIMMWNPPYTMAAAMPLGLLPPRTGQVAWLLLSLLAVAASAALLWNTYGGDARKRWVALVLAFTFVPTLFVLQTGQITAFVLFGAALFAWCCRRGWEFLAGGAAVLIAIKPHLAALLWLAVGLDAVCNRRWRIVAGGVAAGLLATGVVMAVIPGVWGQYFEAYRSCPIPPSKWVSLTLGVVLRLAYGTEQFWLQFVPLALVAGGFAWHWRRHGRAWDWADQLPSLLACSFVAAPYGAWHFDLVLLLVPTIHRAADFANRRGESAGWVVPLCALAVANIAMLVMSHGHVWSFWYCWVAPLVLVGYALTAPRREPVRALA